MLLTVDPTTGGTEGVAWSDLITVRSSARKDLEERWFWREALQPYGIVSEDCSGRDNTGVEWRGRANLQYCIVESLARNKAFRYDIASSTCTLAHQPDAKGCWHRPTSHVPVARNCTAIQERGHPDRPAFCRNWTPWRE